jgi:hypothetical protein
MAEPHVVCALKAKRAELAGEIELTTRQLQTLRAALEHLDATLCLFDPAAVPDAIEPKVWRPNADWAKRGEMIRICLDTLRRASAPLCNRDIALVLMTARGMDTDDERLVKLIAKRVGCCLRGQREIGLVKSEDGPGQTVVWRLRLSRTLPRGAAEAIDQ